jgi:hypothetical protein
LISSPTKPLLSEVTLVAVTSVAFEATVDALRKSMRQATFGRVLFLSDRRPAVPMEGIEWVAINPMRSRADYSRFMLHELARFVDTKHVLCTQWDGFVLHGDAWRPEFAEYDYIGAPWPHFADAYRVGNGGFSLRSRRLLEACEDIPCDGLHAEDVLIGRVHRERLEALGIRFAPEELAAEFAYERTAPTGHEFGFHGAYNLVEHLSRAEASAIFGSLDPLMLSNGERREVFRWAIRRGRLNLARKVLRRR